MHDMDFFSPAQCVGYVALVFGVTAFLQTTDWKLKFFNGLESCAYFVHFLLLGNPTAVVSISLSGARSFLAIKFQKRRLAFLFIAANLVIGAYYLKSPAGALPIVGSCFATWAAFTMRGIPMRGVFLVCTLCWLANNILSGSIGGTVLETFIATANLTTIVRLIASRSREKRAAATPIR